jgi:hypothetical protein
MMFHFDFICSLTLSGCLCLELGYKLNTNLTKSSFQHPLWTLLTIFGTVGVTWLLGYQIGQREKAAA